MAGLSHAPRPINLMRVSPIFFPHFFSITQLFFVLHLYLIISVCSTKIIIYLTTAESVLQLYYKDAVVVVVVPPQTVFAKWIVEGAMACLSAGAVAKVDAVAL